MFYVGLGYRNFVCGDHRYAQVERVYDVDLGCETLRELDTGLHRSICVIREIDGNNDRADGSHEFASQVGVHERVLCIFGAIA